MATPIGNITLELTYRCHRRCAFCYVAGSSSVRELPGHEIARLACEAVRATGCRHVQLSGGEPLLRRDILSIIARVREAGARVSIITDGAHLDPPLARSLVELGVSMVQPTLLAGSAGLHDALRGDGSFRDATRAIATAAAAGLAVSVCMVVTKRNSHEAAQVAELAFSLGARGLALSRFCPVGPARAAFTALMPDASQVRAAAAGAARACRALDLPLAAAVTIPRCVWNDPEEPPLRLGVCSLVGPKATVTIDPSGAVRTCSLSAVSVGDLLKEPWQAILPRWESALDACRAATPEPCRGCRHVSRCLGGCRLSAMAVSDEPTGLDPLAPASCAEG